MAKVKVKDVDRGYKRILNSLSELAAKPYVKVGALQKSGNHDDSDITIAELLTIHEFGAPQANIPERAPIRKTLDQKKSDITQLQEKVYKQVIDGKTTVENGLELMGQDLKRKIQDTIRSGLTPPWAESTLQERLSRTSKPIIANTPLIDSGQLLRSIDYEVVIATTITDKGVKI